MRPAAGWLRSSSWRPRSPRRWTWRRRSGSAGVTLWKWGRRYTSGGVAGLVRARTGPKGPIKLTGTLTARIVELDATGLTLLKIAAVVGVSTATVRVALGRVGPVTTPALEPLPAGDPFDDAIVASPEQDDHEDDDLADLVVLAAPVARTAERVAARFGDLREAPVVITEGAHLPLAGLLLALPALEMTGLLDVAGQTFPPMSKGFYGLRVTLLMGVFMALLREPRPRRARPGSAPPTWAGSWAWIGHRRSRRCAANCPSSPATGRARSYRPRSDVITPPLARTRSGSSTSTGTCGSTPAPGRCPRPTSPGCGSPAQPPKRPGSPAPKVTR